MDSEKVIFEKLREELDKGRVTKPTALRARDVYNKIAETPITYCMCSKTARHIYATRFLEWYEDRD